MTLTADGRLAELLESVAALNVKLLAFIGEPEVVTDKPAASAPCRLVPTDEELLGGLRLDQERRDLRPNSISIRHNRVAELMAWMDPCSVLDATREDVEAWLDSLGVSNASRRAYLSHIGQFFDWCVDKGFSVANPTARIKARPQSQRLPRPFTDAELTDALDPAHFGRTYAHRRLRAFLLLGAFAGLRCQEIAGLCAEDVDVAGGALSVRRGKGGKERAVPLHPDVQAALEALPMPAYGPLFRLGGHLGDGDQLRAHNVGQMVNSYLRSIGVTKTAHCLRHSFATNIYRGSQDLILTQKLLGHSSVATTQIYAACDQTKAAPVVAALSVGNA